MGKALVPMVILNGQICDPSKEEFDLIIQFAGFCQGYSRPLLIC